ncbi:MAG: hypothetical protein RL329_1042 [Bacteroidota bacterium]|jgi:hypothetical protein
MIAFFMGAVAYVRDSFFYDIYFTHDGFAIGWMYGFHGFTPIGTDS